MSLLPDPSKCTSFSCGSQTQLEPAQGTGRDSIIPVFDLETFLAASPSSRATDPALQEMCKRMAQTMRDTGAGIMLCLQPLGL